jgi:hypothetical protein
VVGTAAALVSALAALASLVFAIWTSIERRTDERARRREQGLLRVSEALLDLAVTARRSKPIPCRLGERVGRAPVRTAARRESTGETLPICRAMAAAHDGREVDGLAPRATEEVAARLHHKGMKRKH